jgi:hypothetical protein
MHPLTLFDAALREHVRQAADLDQAHEVARHRRDRRNPSAGRTTRPPDTRSVGGTVRRALTVRTVRRTPATRGSSTAQRPTASTRSAADGLSATTCDLA